jgi:hypothetical protein
VSRNRYADLFEGFVLVLSAFPILFLGAFYNYVLMARLHLGYWPQYARPDPKQLGWWLPHACLWLGFTCLPGLLAATLYVILFARCRSREFPVAIALALLAGSLATFFACVSIDPGGFFNWFAD